VNLDSWLANGGLSLRMRSIKTTSFLFNGGVGERT
jgi:hypothetical protein